MSKIQIQVKRDRKQFADIVNSGLAVRVHTQTIVNAINKEMHEQFKNAPITLHEVEDYINAETTLRGRRFVEPEAKDL